MYDPSLYRLLLCYIFVTHRNYRLQLVSDQFAIDAGSNWELWEISLYSIAAHLHVPKSFVTYVFPFVFGTWKTQRWLTIVLTEAKYATANAMTVDDLATRETPATMISSQIVWCNPSLLLL